MILFVDDNSGILFLKRWLGKIWGTITTFTTVAGNLTRQTVVQYITGTITTDTSVLGQMIGYGRMTGHIWTMTGVYATFDKWLTEIFKGISKITRLFKKNSDIDGD